MPSLILEEGSEIILNGRAYTIEKGINRGGSGEVYCISSGRANFALKLFYPFYQGFSKDIPKSIRTLLDMQEKEYQFLSTMSHPNIVSVIDHGRFPLRTAERRRLKITGPLTLPFLIAEFVNGETLDEALKKYPLSAEAIGNILTLLCRSLNYIHNEKKYMHGDIKATNVMIRSSDHQPVLIDFALSKNLDFSQVSPQGDTPLLGDWDLFPHLADNHPLKLLKEQQHATREEIFNMAFPTLDLFDFGKMLESLKSALFAFFADRDRTYLSMLIEELTNWSLARAWTTELLEDRVSRLSPDRYLVFGVPELTAATVASRAIMIPPNGAVPISARLETLINNRSFRRLAHIQQLSMACLIYPAADYKRLVHVLYSYEIARRMITQLYATPIFRFHFNARNCQRLLATVLSHDINHFPFLHVFEEARLPGFDTLGLFDLFCNGIMTGERAVGEPSFYDLLGEIGLDPTTFPRLAAGMHTDQRTEVDQIISSFINSGADVDKMAYLFLDSYFTGVSYGAGIDFPALFKAASVDKIENTDRLHLVFTDSGIQAAENLVMTRYSNFRSIYWHHTNRAIMCMILHVVRSLYRDSKINFQRYLEDTLWKGDVEVLRYLDEQYEHRYRRGSILRDLPQDRRKLFKRLYTVRAGEQGGNQQDDDLYRRLKTLSYDDEIRLRSEIGDRLPKFLGLAANTIHIGPEEVIIDTPRREMDTGGQVYISVPGHRGARPLQNISSPVRAIDTNYELLTKRIRIFISPRLSEYLSSTEREDKRGRIYEIIRESLETISNRSPS